MKFRSIVAAAALSLVAAPALAQKPAGQNRRAARALDGSAEQAAIAFSLERGRLLFGLDRAAWVATDDFIERMPNYQSEGARGYVVELAPEGYAVTFLGGPENAPVAFYRADVRQNRVHSSEVFPASARPALTPAQRRLLNARNAAAAAVRGRSCNGSPFNSAVVPPSAPYAPVDVYLLTPQLDQGRYPIGGHFRLTVEPDGRAGAERAFTNSCLLMSLPDVPGGGRVTSMNVTHLLDPVPTEIHVFTALTSGFPVYVAIGSPFRLYHVTGDAIRRVR